MTARKVRVALAMGGAGLLMTTSMPSVAQGNESFGDPSWQVPRALTVPAPGGDMNRSTERRETASWLDGNVPPTAWIFSDYEPEAVAVDATGRMYVAEKIGLPWGYRISVYPPDWAESSEPLQPLKVLQGPRTELSGPTAIAFDQQGRMVVTNIAAPESDCAPDGHVSVYPYDWASGDTPPIKVLRSSCEDGVSPGLVDPTGIAFDSTGRMYVVNRQTVTVYEANWPDGNTPPIKMLVGRSTQLLLPHSIAFDSDGHMYVTDPGKRQVNIYSPNWPSGDTAPEQVIGEGSGIRAPYGIAIHDDGTLAVTNLDYYRGDSVTVYSLPVEGDSPVPVATLQGSATKLAEPSTIAFGLRGSIFVGNSVDSYTVTAYAKPVAPSAPTDVTAKPGDASAVVSWRSPSNDGGRPVESYEVRASPGSSTCQTTRALTCVVTGLINGVSYVFTVTASNQVGVSPPSEPSVQVTPESQPRTPGAIRDPKATTSGKTTTITWKPPANAANITAYQWRVGSSPRTMGEWQSLGNSSTKRLRLRNYSRGATWLVDIRAQAGSSYGPTTRIRYVS